mgnify:CR=1 FL=1
MEQTYFRRGFGLRKQIEPLIRSEYHSALVERIRANGYQDSWGEGEGRVTVRLAEEFGFCYGVDRAVEYAYETRTQFPGRRIFLLGEIIHNPHVNRRLTDMGVVFLQPDARGRFDFGGIAPGQRSVLYLRDVTKRKHLEFALEIARQIVRRERKRGDALAPSLEHALGRVERGLLLDLTDYFNASALIKKDDLAPPSSYYQFQGGMTAAVRQLSGIQPQIYFGDHSNPQSPKLRSLEQEISRVVRARVTNPKWIDGVKRHAGHDKHIADLKAWRL